MSRKRFTDAEKWRDPWFRKLPWQQKLLWLYLCDNCDAAGVIEVDVERWAFEIGAPYAWKNEIAGLGDRVELMNAGQRLRIVKFIDFQYPRGLNAKAPAQLQVLRLMSKYGIPIPSANGSPIPTPMGRQSQQDKDTDMDKETDKEKETERPDPTDLFHVEPKSDPLSVAVNVVRNVRPPISDIDQLRHAGAFIGRDEAGAWQLLVDTFTLERLVTVIRKVVASGDRAFRSTVAAALGHAAPPTDEYKIIDGQRVRVIR